MAGAPPFDRSGFASATETYTIATAYVAPASTKHDPDELFRLGNEVLMRWLPWAQRKP
jgi:hypothetical protein